MKKSELNFKCILGSKKRNKQMLDAIAKANLKNSIQESNFIDNAACLWINDSFFGEVSPTYACIISDNYESCESPEVTFAEALLLLNSVDPDAPEFDIKPFDKIIYRIDDQHTSNWAPALFAHIRIFAWGIGTEEPLKMFAKYEGNEKFCGADGLKEDANAYPAGWWECKNGKPVWKTK